MRAVLAWLGWVLPSFSATLLGAATPPGEWGQTHADPDWTPPGWVFPVVWTTLYALMGTAAWMAWRRESPAAAWLLAPYVVWVSIATVLNFEIWRLNA